MIEFKISFLVLTTFVFFGCRKDIATSPQKTDVKNCNLYTSIGLDSSYIPHKKNNSWTYCNSSADYYANIVLDTIKSGVNYFEYIENYGLTSHNGMGCICDVTRIIIDSLGNYFSIRSDYTYPADTLKIIDVYAANGDTLFKSRNSPNYVLLLNRSDVFENIQDCYHIKIVYPGNVRVDEFFFKKGLGIVSHNNSRLINAQLH